MNDDECPQCVEDARMNLTYIDGQMVVCRAQLSELKQARRRELRKLVDRGMTQSQIARALGMNRQRVSALLRGR